MSGDKRPEFPDTPWTIIRKAAASGAPEAQQALADLCRIYWYPLYVFVRRKGRSVEDAQDDVQGFFARFLARNHLENLDPEVGRFRSYLLRSLKNYMAEQRRRAAADKRSATLVPLVMDFGEAESRFVVEPVAPGDPEREFMRKWALALLDHVLRRLQREYRRGGRSEEFELLRGFLPGSRSAPGYEEAARRAGVTTGTLRTRVSRLRARYRELLEREVGRTVTTPEEVAAEIRFLTEVLGNRT